MATTYTTGKAKRESLAIFYRSGTTPTFVYNLIGKGIEDISTSPSAQIDTVHDVTGQTQTTLSAYEKATDLDPIYMEGDNLFAQFLDNIEETDAVLDDAKATFCIVKMYKTDGTDYTAYTQQAVVELTGFGGDVKGVNLPCTLHWVGDKTMGTFSATTHTFTADT